MKKMYSKAAVTIAAIAGLSVFVSCGTTSNSAGTTGSTSSDTKAMAASAVVAPQKSQDEFAVVDWFGRALDEPAAPTWLKNMSRGNSDLFKKEKGLEPGRIVKFSSATGRTEPEAQAFSRAGFTYSQAAELNQKVIGRVGQGLNDEGQLEALYLAASESKAQMAGLREELTFWQKVRSKNIETQETREYYIYYTVYSMDKATWDAIVQNYMQQILTKDTLTSETKQKVGALFSEMKEDSDKVDAKKAEEEKKLYDAQMARIRENEAKANAEAARAKADAAASSAEAAKASQKTAEAALEAKKIDAEEARARRAAEEARENLEWMQYLE